MDEREHLDLPKLDVAPGRRDAMHAAARIAFEEAAAQSGPGRLWRDRLEPGLTGGLALGMLGWAIGVILV